jgi:hypothetical protein
MPDEAKRRAQEALYAAIQDQAENNMRAALSAPDKAALLRELAEAYRLTAGGGLPAGTGRREMPPEGGARASKRAGSARRGRADG